MSPFGKTVKAIQIDDDNRNMLVGRLNLTNLDQEFTEALPTGWYVIMPFGERGVHFWSAVSPETFKEHTDGSAIQPLANGFFEVFFN